MIGNPRALLDGEVIAGERRQRITYDITRIYVRELGHGTNIDLFGIRVLIIDGNQDISLTACPRTFTVDHDVPYPVYDQPNNPH
jgi:hypothetical protein